MDAGKAVAWYRRAAGVAVVEAQYNLAYMLDNGLGTARSPDEAARWYREAAKNGFGPAQLALGYLYLRGAGIPKDIVEAWAWFRAAESRKAAGAATARRQTGKDLTPAQLDRATSLAAPRLRK